MSFLDGFTNKKWERLAAATAEEPITAPNKKRLGSRLVAGLLATATAVTTLLSPADANAEAQNNDPEITDIANMDATFDKGRSKDLVIKTTDAEATSADFSTAFVAPTSNNNITVENVGPENSLLISPENQRILDELQPGDILSATVITEEDPLNIRDENGDDTRRNARRGAEVSITPDQDRQVIVVRRSFTIIDGSLIPSSGLDIDPDAEFEMDLIQTNQGYLAAAYLQFGEISNQTASSNIDPTTFDATQTVAVQLPIQDLAPSSPDTVEPAQNAEASDSPTSAPAEAATQFAPENNAETADQSTISPDTTDLETQLEQLREERQDLNEGLRFAQEGFEQYDTIRYEQEIQEATANTQRLIDSYQAFSSSLRGLRNNMARREADNQIAILTAHLGTLEHEANQMRRDILAYSAIREYYYHLIRLYGLKIQLNQLHISVLQDTPNNEVLARIDDLSSEITDLEAHLEFPFGPFDTPSPFVLSNLASESETILLPQEHDQASRRCTGRLPANQEFLDRECEAEQKQIDAQNYLAQTSLNDFQNQEFQDKLQTIRAIAEAYPTNERQRKSLATLYLSVLNLDEILPGEILILASHADVYPFERLLDTNSTLYRELSDWQTSPEHFIGSHQVHQENIIAALALTQRTSDINISALVENYLVPDLEQKVALGIYDEQDLDLAISLLEKFSEATQQQIGHREFRLLNEAAIPQLDEAYLIPVDDSSEADEITELDPDDLIPVDVDFEADEITAKQPQIEEPKQTREIKAYHELIDEELIYKTAAGKMVPVTMIGPSLHENDPGLIFEKENGSQFAVSGRSLRNGRLYQEDETPIILNHVSELEKPDWEKINQIWEEIAQELDEIGLERAA